MPSKRLSKAFLYKIRNNINIRKVIADILGMEWKISDAYFRFLCPACNSFNTATDKKTNMGRCFDCKRNFNNIDLVMIMERLDFLQAVDMLKICFNIKEVLD